MIAQPTAGPPPSAVSFPPTRYGNMFYVRDNGESKAVQQAVGVLTQCLGAPEGCKVSSRSSSGGSGSSRFVGVFASVRSLHQLPDAWARVGSVEDKHGASTPCILFCSCLMVLKRSAALLSPFADHRSLLPPGCAGAASRPVLLHAGLLDGGRPDSGLRVKAGATG